MKLSFAIATMAIAAAASVAAQAPQNGEKVTVSGCLNRAQRNGSLGGTVVGTSASPNTADVEANSAAIVDAFLLSEATPAGSGTTASANPGAPAADSPTGTAGRQQITSYGLSGHEAELEQHQGARVQVTGTIESPASSGRGTGGAATAAGTKRIKVESFTVLADTCPAR
jgi:hypothetical protein